MRNCLTCQEYQHWLSKYSGNFKTPTERHEEVIQDGGDEECHEHLDTAPAKARQFSPTRASPGIINHRLAYEEDYNRLRAQIWEETEEYSPELPPSTAGDRLGQINIRYDKGLEEGVYGYPGRGRVAHHRALPGSNEEGEEEENKKKKEKEQWLARHYRSDWSQTSGWDAELLSDFKYCLCSHPYSMDKNWGCGAKENCRQKGPWGLSVGLSSYDGDGEDSDKDVEYDDSDGDNGGDQDRGDGNEDEDEDKEA